jgi:hypothetical protein
MMPPRLRVALPWLQLALAEAVASATLPTLESLAWLGGRGRLQTVAGVGWRDWLLDPLGGASILSAAPAGPALAACRGQVVDGTGSWCLAQPVHLAAGLDHVRMGALQAAQPNAAEAAALAATIAAHFADDGLAVIAFVDGAWLLRFDADVQCDTQPPDAVVGHDVHAAMPSGRDGARVRSLTNEVQMLLHEHPVNLQRERARLEPINGWWLWGFGSRAPVPLAATAGWSLRGDDPWLRALWAESGAPEVSALQGDTLIAVSRPPSAQNAQALADIDAGLLHPLAAQVRNGALQQLELLLGDRELTVTRAARWSCWRRPLDVSGWLG